jgi:hypothetical protein
LAFDFDLHRLEEHFSIFKTNEMKKKEILLVIVLILFGVIYRAIEKGKIQFANDFSFYSETRRLKGSKFSEFPEKEKLFPAVDKITIQNPAGEVTVNRSSDGQVHLFSFLRVYYTDKDIVNEIRKKAIIKTDLDHGQLKISGQYAAAFPFQNLRILFRLLVPEGTVLAIANQEGDTIIRDTGKDIHVDQKNGNLVLENIPSGLKLRLKNCNAKIKSIADHVEIYSSRSNLILEDAFSLHFQGKNGDCSVKKVKNDVFLEHSYGKLVIDDVGKLEISARYSNIIAKNIKNGAIVTDKYENIFLENISGDIRVASRLSRIDLRNISARNVVIENSFADTSIVDFTSENLNLLIKNGNLDLQVKNVASRINIESQHAKLNLVFGVLSDPTINIKARQGQIYVDSPLQMEKYEENAEIFLNRTGMKPEILVHNIYGDIHIKTAH